MIIGKYKEIVQKSDKEKNVWALGLSVTLTLFIFFGWVFYNGYIDLGKNSTVVVGSDLTEDMASVLPANDAPSPLQSSKETFGAAFSEIGKKYNEFKDSMSAVLVPFVTGIEIYERQK